MDWVDEVLSRIRGKIKNMSLKKAMAVYILIFIILTFTVSMVTMEVCKVWEKMIWNQYNLQTPYDAATSNYDGLAALTDGDRTRLMVLTGVETWCPYIYAIFSMIAVSAVFYKKRLKEPFEILRHGTEEIKKNNLDVQLHYESEDEMGQLCDSFEEMRKELIKNKEEMWRLLDEKQRLNAAFAHDLRTPLTVLRGYVDILSKFLPEGKISQEKLVDTFGTMSEHIARLEQYTNTMKNIHSLEDMPVKKETADILRLQEKMEGITEGLNQIGIISVLFHKHLEKRCKVNVDENIILEVMENLLSNALRYANCQVDVFLEHDRKGKKLMLYVKDDGRGFSEEELKKAANPYYRGQREQEPVHFGIGLHICSLLCEKHGGELSLSNSIACGAIVSAAFSYMEKE